MKTIICDLDGTLFNIDHRLHFLDSKEWDKFFEACKDDTVNEWCLELLNAMKAAGHEIAFVSGRNSIARAETNRQLVELGFFPNTILLMRHELDRRPDYELKQEFLENELKDKDILFAIDDRSQVVRMYRSKKITVLQCDEGEF